MFLLTPSINSVTGAVVHKDNLTISGTDFGIKDPARPLMWDDGEGKTVNNYSAVVESGYTQVSPAPSREGEAIPSTHQLVYRSAPYAAVSQPVNPPHNRSSQYMVGGHYENFVGPHSGRDVSLTVSTPSGFEKRWFATWYYAVNPEWPSCGYGPNHKIMTMQAGTQAYSNAPYTNQFYYMNFPNTGKYRICDKANQTLVNSMNIGAFYNGTWCNYWYWNPSACNSNTPLGDGKQWLSNSPANGNWVRLENRISDDQGFLHFLIDNHYVWRGESKPGWVGNYTPVKAGIRSYTLGGYYRHYLNVSGFQNDNAFRYFDDVYVDSTLARVMLANSQNYSNATIIEPQIPFAWSDNSISVTVNLGKFNDGDTAYLFVFDADNNHNEVGYPVNILSETTNPVCWPGLLNSCSRVCVRNTWMPPRLLWI